MSQGFERNISPKSPRDVEAEGIVRLLGQRERNYEINLDFPRYLERKLTSMWSAEGYSAPQVFVDTQGNPIIIAHEDASIYDERGIIKPAVDMRYRFYLEDETRDVTVPRELAAHAAQKLEHGDVGLYDATEANVRELALRKDAATFADDLEWLKGRFGESLAITRPRLGPTRLDGDSLVVGVALDSFPPFSESDF
jgi:hypothetical protein